MTDTNTLAPSYAEIDAIADQHKASGHGTVWPHAFARAVLAKWGAPAPASQPFAYEFSRSNGDGTHSEHIERGRLQEVAPGRWEHSGLPRGALADKPIKALYTTPQTQPAAVPASGPVGFDHKTAANFLNGKAVTEEEVRRFVAHSRWAHDDRDGLRNTIADLRREIAQRDSEIALLKTSLLDVEAPQPAAQALDSVRVFWQQHTKSDALSMTMTELHADVELVIRAARGAAQAAPRNGALAAPAQPVTWPRNAAEVREFMDAHCQREERANDDSSPSDDDLYALTAHDFLSAVNWWADSHYHP